MTVERPWDETRLREIEPAGKSKHREILFLYQCQCGRRKVIPRLKVISGSIRSCGCLLRKIAQEMGKSWTTHGDTKNGTRTAEFVAWQSMKYRCSNPRMKTFKYYGGRGITVCERWNLFENFLADMGRKPGPKYSLDRINNEGSYEPTNCRWATQSEQIRNRRKLPK